MVKEELVTLINNYLKPPGFRKKDKSWYKENPETITMFSLSQSRWGDTYYVILSVNFRGLNEEKRPKFYKCHSQLRAESLDEITEEYLNLEKDINEDVRKQRIKQLLDKSLPILHKMETISGFKSLLKEFNPRLFMLSTEAQKYLGIHVE